MFSGSFWSVLPSVLAIALALIIKEPHISLFIGAVTGALLVADFNPLKALDIFINKGIIKSVCDNAGIIAFVVILGIIIGLINKMGGAASFGKWASKHIKTQRGAMLSTFLLGVLIFIDDMFNCFTVGAVMTPITDRQKISRQKLAWLLDATAAPVCMIAPISSWGAAVSSTAEGLGTGISGIELFIRAIPYNFYSLFTFVFIIAIGLMNFDYGEMKKYQISALNGDLGQKSQKTENIAINGKGKIIDLLIPVSFMIAVCVLMMLYVGGFFSKSSENYGNLANAFGNTDGAVALSMGGTVTLVFAVIYSLLRKTTKFKNITECITESFNIMGSPLLILILAVSLKNMTSLLDVSGFISRVMTGAAENLYSMLPAVIFIVACIFSFASGTSWGTFGILIPIVTAVFPADSKLVIIGISACLAGAVCGDHCSPISDTTIMSSAAAGCEHLTHVSTQLPYAVTVAVISFFVYILAGFVQNAPICLVAGAFITVAALYLIKLKNKD